MAKTPIQDSYRQGCTFGVCVLSAHGSISIRLVISADQAPLCNFMLNFPLIRRQQNHRIAV